MSEKTLTIGMHTGSFGSESHRRYNQTAGRYFADIKYPEKKDLNSAEMDAISLFRTVFLPDPILYQ